MSFWGAVKDIGSIAAAPIVGIPAALGLDYASGGNASGAIGGAWDWASGASATQDANQQQQAGALQAQGALNNGLQQAQAGFQPYASSGLRDYTTLRNGVNSGAYSPQFQGYQGPMSSGGANSPQYRSYQGPMQSQGMFSPQFQGYQGQMGSGIMAPQYQGYNGAMSSGLTAPQFQGYQGPMSSGNNLPQYQQYGGPSGTYQAQSRPDMQAPTAANIQAYANPFLDQIISQGTNAIAHSGAARGLFGSTGNINDIGTFATQAASQNYNDAANRFTQDQMARQGQFENDRSAGAGIAQQNFQNNYGMNQAQNAWNANNADRGQNWFEGDRAAGLQNNQFQNQYGMNAANFNQGVFEGDRSAGLANNQFQNTYGMNQANFNQSAFQDARNAGMANTQANNANALQYANFNQGAFEGDRSAGMANTQMNNANATNLANFNQNAFEGDRAAGLGYNQYQNTWNANQSQNNYNMANNLSNMGYNAAGQLGNLYTNYGNNMADIYTAMANANAASTMTQSSQRRGLFGDIVNAGTKIGGLLAGG